MPTPRKGYFLPDGEQCPGTTTVIGRFKDASGLMQWAFKQGKAGKASLYEDAEKAADIGTCAHAMVEAHINGEDPEQVLLRLFPDGNAQARNAFNMFLEWSAQTKIKFLSRYQEIGLVSQIYKFGGTPDAIGEINGKIVLIDWKTSNAVYSDHLIQLAAYTHLVNRGLRMDTYEPLGLQVEGAHLCRFAKEYPDFSHHYYGDVLNVPWRQFLLFRRAYDLDKELKKRVA